MQFHRLLANLDTLAQQLRNRERNFPLAITIRTGRKFQPDRDFDPALRDRVAALRTLAIVEGTSSEVDNWGGLISDDDVNDLEMDLIDGHFLYKKGACSLPFDTIQVTAAGHVNACACLDPKGSLFLGDLSKRSLSEILGYGNPAWRQLIENQMNGTFEGACEKCSFYNSIYDSRWSKGYEEGGILSFKDAFARKKEFDREA